MSVLNGRGTFKGNRYSSDITWIEGRDTMFDRSRRTTLVLLFTTCVVLCACLALRRYHSYVAAKRWHLIEGNDVQIGAYKISLPQLWWRTDDAAYDTPLFLRATESNTSLGPQIVVAPAITGEVRGTEQEELEITERLITVDNKGDMGRSASLVVLKTKPFTLYCEKEEASPMGVKLYSHLTCHAAAIPYTFIYQGPPMFEIEAELILSTLR